MSIGDEPLPGLVPVEFLNLDTLEPEQLAAYAHKAFLLGLIDGTSRKSPRTSRAVMDELFPMAIRSRNFHRIKFRQVYGAGFDMACLTAFNLSRESREPALTDH